MKPPDKLDMVFYGAFLGAVVAFLAAVAWWTP